MLYGKLYQLWMCSCFDVQIRITSLHNKTALVKSTIFFYVIRTPLLSNKHRPLLYHHQLVLTIFDSHNSRPPTEPLLHWYTTPNLEKQPGNAVHHAPVWKEHGQSLVAMSVTGQQPSSCLLILHFWSFHWFSNFHWQNVYHIAGKFGGEFNLANWWICECTAKLNSANIPWCHLVGGHSGLWDYSYSYPQSWWWRYRFCHQGHVLQG